MADETFRRALLGRAIERVVDLLVPVPGTSIHACAEAAIAYVGITRRAAVLRWNGLLLDVKPGDTTVEQLVDRSNGRPP